MNDCQDNSSAFLSGFLLGGIAGAAAFFLFGTEKGKEVKEILLEEGKDLLEDLKETRETKDKEAKPQSEVIPKSSIQEGPAGKVKRFFSRNGQILK